MSESLVPETPIAIRIHTRLEDYGSKVPTIFRIVRNVGGLNFYSCPLNLNELTGHLNRHEAEEGFYTHLNGIEALYSPITGEWEYI